MKIEKMAAQGDLLARRVERIPVGSVVISGERDHVVAHSETGHHHVAVGIATLHRPQDGDGMVSFLDVPEEVVLTHHRPWDTHHPITLTAGVWELRRQREHTPQGWRRVED